ncbi:MAG TPA: TetR/AcrR family transcriptional regulator [Iamia sp.]
MEVNVTERTSVEVAVLDAAARLLVTEGPHALSIRRIATAAGVAPMSIYNRFESKAGVLDALWIRGFDRLAALRDDLPDTAPIERLRAFAGLYRSFALGDPGTYALMFDRAVPDFVPSPDAMLRAHSCFACLVETVHDVQVDGTLVGGDPVEVAQRLWAALHGAVSLERHGICFAPDSDQHYTALVETLLRGLDPAHGLPGGATP